MESGPKNNGLALKPVVAFLGPPASFSHQATKSAFPTEQWDLLPTVTIKEIFEVVQGGEAEFGVVPFENSSHGTVMFTLDNLADRNHAFKDLLVCGEVYLDVHHYLLGRKAAARPLEDSGSPGTCTPTADHPNPVKPRASPLSNLKHVQRIYSHPQAFGQTAAFISTYLRGVDTIDVSSTSKAAELVSRDGTGESAAIASEIAAELNGLDILARCIEDREDNTTRFFVIRRTADNLGPGIDTPVGQAGTTAMESAGDQQRRLHKSLVSFTVSHGAPGALADVLDCFKRYTLNLTSINSLPSLIQPFQYLFFVEFEGSRLRDEDGRVEKALQALAKVAQGWRWLGSWESKR